MSSSLNLISTFLLYNTVLCLLPIAPCYWLSTN
jgi:hypothetical protein